MNPNTADLLELIYDLKGALEFDAENCDFGPAYGMWEERRKNALKRATSILRETKFQKIQKPVKTVRKQRGDTS